MTPELNSNLNKLSATQLLVMLGEKQITPDEIITDCLRQIKLRNPEINAWKFLDEDIIKKQLEEFASLKPISALSGIPMAIKDNFDTKDMPTEYGTSIYSGFQPETDSKAIELLRKAGVLFLGKTITSEFAGPYPGPTLNPHDLSRTPGVSSMGSAASVADFMAPIANGTQTGGSIIRPASLCGIYGYKGSFNHITGAGIKHIKPSIDTVGHFARCIEDIELLRQVLRSDINIQKFDALTLPRKIGICKTSNWHAASHDTKNAINKTIEAFVSSHCNIIDITLPKEFDTIMERAFQIIYSWELRNAHRDEIDAHFDKFNPWFKWAIQYLQDVTFEDYKEALQEAEQTRAILKNIFDEVDIIITPSAIGEAPKELLEIPKYSFNHLWTLMYVPCVNLPFYLGTNGLPVGIQVIGAQNTDAQLLGYCKAIENRMINYFGTNQVSVLT
jgi:Asp-tRNA(Asn)/Glu-tRNA(Gln) amidotransferase A subunit family amidase